jgi:hypothetical protein
MKWCGDVSLSLSARSPKSAPEGVGLSPFTTRTQFQDRHGCCEVLQSGSVLRHTAGWYLRVTSLCFSNRQPYSVVFQWFCQEVERMLDAGFWIHNVRLETHDEMSQVYFVVEDSTLLCLCITFFHTQVLSCWFYFNWLNEDRYTFSIQL